jgi:predicted PurR-regulated permease PerM
VTQDRSNQLLLAVPLWILTVIGLLFLLQAMRVLLVPIALAGLASAVLYPVVARLERLRVPPVLGAALVLLLIVGSIGWMGWALQDEATQMARELPRQIRQVRLQMERTTSSGTLNRLREALDEVRKAAETASQPSMAPARAPAPDAGTPAPAGAAAGTEAVQRYVWLGSTGAVNLAGSLTVITFLSYFLLIGAHSLRLRLLALLERSDRRIGNEVIDEIVQQVQRFLAVRVITAIIVGVATWLALRWLDAPAAGLWSVAAGVLNSVPFFGPLIVSVGLAAVGLISGGFSEAMQYGGVALVITSIEGWLITPPLLGQAARMNTLAVFVGLLVWSWLWGVWGTLLAVPLMSVVKAVADRVEALKPVSRLLAP